jgi:hypothetical protein
MLPSIRIVRLRTSWDRRTEKARAICQSCFRTTARLQKLIIADRGKFLSTIDPHRAASSKNARTENALWSARIDKRGDDTNTAV